MDTGRRRHLDLYRGSTPASTERDALTDAIELVGEARVLLAMNQARLADRTLEDLHVALRRIRDGRQSGGAAPDDGPGDAADGTLRDVLEVLGRAVQPSLRSFLG